MIEKLFGDAATVTDRIEATAHCAGNASVHGYADFAVNTPGWQFRSFSLEIAPEADVLGLTVACVRAAHRGAVFFDQVTVVDEVAEGDPQLGAVAR